MKPIEVNELHQGGETRVDVSSEGEVSTQQEDLAARIRSRNAHRKLQRRVGNSFPSNDRHKRFVGEVVDD